MTTSIVVRAAATQSPKNVDVYWCVGKHRQGVVRVAVRLPVSDLDLHVVAELCALHHLLEVAEVCGSDRTGNSMEITCTCGSIKKLAAGLPENTHLSPFALFLRTRFSDAVVHVNQASEFIEYPAAHSNPTNIEVSSVPLSSIRFGDGTNAAVTHQALLRYHSRFNATSMSNAWRAIRAAASCPKTYLERRSSIDLSPYGKTVRTYRSKSLCRLVVVVHPEGARIVDCHFAPFK